MPYALWMSKSQHVTVPLDATTSCDLDRLAAEWNCTRDHIAMTALLRFLNEETRHWPSEFEPLPPFVETDPLAIALNESESEAIAALHAYLSPERHIEPAGLYPRGFMREMKQRYRSRDAA